MNIQKFLPWVNLALLLVLLPLVATNSCSRPETVVVGDSALSAVVAEDAKEALQNAEELLEADDFSGAFDMLLVASRLAPSDPNLFDLVIRFVRQADSSKSEDAIAMAEDLIDRGDSLVYFQRTQNVQDARKRLTELREQFISSGPAFEPPTPLDGVMEFMSVAEDASKPTSVRTGAASRAKALLDELQLQIAMGEQPETEQVSQNSLADMYNRIDAIEQTCIESLFVEMTPRIDEWQAGASKVIERANSATNESAPDVARALGETADAGYDLLQELLPYAKSQIESAVERYSEVENMAKELLRQKSWLYNKQSLARIREIERASGPALKWKLAYLAEIHEEQLSPYVLRRHNEVWEKVFEELPNEDEKVDAVRMRMLRSSE